MQIMCVCWYVCVCLRVVHVFAYIYVCDLGDCENSCAIIYVYVVMCLNVYV